MTVTVADARPEALNVPFRPGNSLTLTITWPTGDLAGRTFSSTLEGTALGLSILGDVMTVEATEAQTLAVLTSATWLLTETTGGASNDLLIGEWAPSTRPGTPSSYAVTVTAGAVEVAVTVSSSAAPATELVHVWATDGWDPFTTRFVVNQDGAVVLTPSVVGRRGRITASADTSGNHREWFLHEGTSWADGEIEATLYAPSNWDTGPPIKRPQHGLVCRAQPIPGTPGTWRAFVVSLDMAFGTSGMNADTWQGDGTTLTLGSGDVYTAPSINLVRRQLRVRHAARINVFDAGQYRTFPDARTSDMFGLVDGDLLTVAGMVDTSFNRTAIAATNVNTGTGFFQFVDTTANDNTDTVAGGTVDFVSLLKSHFPRRVAVLLEGNTLFVKHWRPEEARPDWGDTAHVAALTAPTSPALPSGAGLWGVVGAHLHTNTWLEYGDVTFRRR